MDSKERLITKWLNDELTPEELEAFKKLDEYASYSKISEKAKHFKAPEFDEQLSLEQIESKKSSNRNKSNPFKYKYIAAFVAVLVVSFTLIKILYNNPDPKSFKTGVATTETIKLPDHSVVNLNSNSKISYDESEWSDTRNLHLNGEAFFKVQHGGKFNVTTNYGDVQVLGTAFNVRSRKYAFEVFCFKGSVSVNVKDDFYVLEAKEKLTLNNKKIEVSTISSSLPDWKTNQTIVKSEPLKNVIKEFKNYYDVEFEISNVDTSQRYTGSFSHDNLKSALKSITLPLDLTYKIDDKKISLSNK